MSHEVITSAVRPHSSITQAIYPVNSLRTRRYVLSNSLTIVRCRFSSVDDQI